LYAVIKLPAIMVMVEEPLALAHLRVMLPLLVVVTLAQIMNCSPSVVPFVIDMTPGEASQSVVVLFCKA
jgi:hypothetical protein